jgi:hypothetical protein
VASKLVVGRDRIYLDRFWNNLASEPPKIDEATRKDDVTMNILDLVGAARRMHLQE